MGDYSDSKQTERICKCPAGKKRLENVVNTLKGSTITEVSFSNCITKIGVIVKLNSNHEILIHLPCLSLDELMQDPEIRAQVKELYYEEYPERRPKPEPDTE
jgi:hypothetical protein